MNILSSTHMYMSILYFIFLYISITLFSYLTPILVMIKEDSFSALTLISYADGTTNGTNSIATANLMVTQLIQFKIYVII